MPISPIVLQRRHAELGRIRLGNKIQTSGGRERPNKLERFRFTSPSERYIRDLAELYGGEPRPWDNNSKAEWEVYSEAQAIPVIAVKGGLSQWMETWSGGGCVHRCDGEAQVDGTPCEQDTTTLKVKVDGEWREVRAHDAARPTTRLSLMLPELEAIGVWRLESHGWNAAAEIPAVAELAQFVGDLVPANLHLIERRVVKDGQTSRFVVPVLDLQIGTARLKEIVAQRSGQAPAELGAPEGRPALEAPKGQDFALPTPEQVQAADVAALRSMLDELDRHGYRQHKAYAAIAARIDHLEDTEEVVDGQVVDDGVDDEQVWQQVLGEAGRQGLSEEELKELFAVEMGGTIVADATGAELVEFLGKLRQIGAAA